MNKFALLVAAVTASAAASADAATIDFTDRSVWSGPSSSTVVHGSTVTLSSSNGVINFAENYTRSPNGVCIGFGGGLGCDSDGLGVNDDEISTTVLTQQTVTVSFSETLRVAGVSFLDLYLAPDGSDLESAEVYFNGDLSTLVSFSALQTLGNNRPGFAFYSLPMMLVDSITFRSALSNDSVGVADFALASIDVQPVPLPAAAWMLLAGVGGIAALRRRTA